MRNLRLSMRTLRPAAVAAGLALLATTPTFAGWDEGVAAFRQGNYAQAAKEFESLSQQRADCGQCHLMLGQSLLALGRSQDAVTALRKAYDLAPNDNGVRLPLAQAYLQAKRYDDAVNLLNTMNASTLPKEKQQVFYKMRAAALDKSGRGDQALDDLRRSAQANPNDAAAQYAFGVAALSAQDTAAAITALEAAVRLDSRSADKKRTLLKAYLLRGRSSQGSTKSGAYGKAVEIGKQLVAASSSGDNLMLLGEAQLGAKQYSSAAGTFEKAAAALSGDWLPLYYLGQAQTISGSVDQAEANLKKALTKTSSSADQTRIWRQLGFVYEKQKNFEEAKMAYRKVGDSSAVARVERNQEIQQENAQIEEHNRQVEEIEREFERLEEEMQGELPPDF